MATEGGSGGLAFTSDYIKSRTGILRILEACIGLCGVISETQGAYCGHWGSYSFYNFVVVTTLILAIIIIVLYTLSLDKLCTVINFNLSILIDDVIFSILYLVAAILMFIAIAACRYGQAARIVAALFAVAGTIVVGLLAFDGYQRARSGSSTASPA